MSVYYVHAPDFGFVKIGHAAQPRRRLADMQTSSPTRLILLAIEDGGADLEAQRHLQFANLRRRGEWFAFEGALAEHIGRLPKFASPSRKALNGPLGAWMKRNGKTLVQVAEGVGTTAASISRICSGKMDPGRAMIRRIFHYTNGQVDANALFGLDPTSAERTA